jgi:uncharacterized protein (TIGR03032 family)
MKGNNTDFSKMWARHSAEWRDGAQICSQWREAVNLDPRLLESHASKGWWPTLAELGVTLLITREYEHLAIAASAAGGRPRLSFFPVPHPSGVTVDRERRRVFLASTRNPNQVYEFKPVTSQLERRDMKAKTQPGKVLAPVSSTFYPGCLYMHDLAVIGSDLYANAVGQNSVVHLRRDGTFENVWWPKCVEQRGRPVLSCNYIQLNSIAAGNSLDASFFSASSSAIGRRRPGHLDYPVDGRGVIFSGLTREPVCEGLTRPHSARFRGKRVWVANSGYGEVGFVSSGRLEVVSRLPGWTRGLCIVGDVAFVATSRVIPRYACYAPGLETAQTRCAVHAVCCHTGKTLGTLDWPYGNQVFAIDWIHSRDTTGFLFNVLSRAEKRENAFFYTHL